MRKLITGARLVTPAMAVTWLEANTHNRPVSDRTVEEYAAQMRAKQWLLNGEAIVFDETGALADGQHRLWACIKADTPFETVVIKNVSKASFATIDTGNKRSAADVLHIGGHTQDRHTLAATASLLLRYRAGKMFSRGAIPRTEILHYVDNNPDLLTWVKAAKKKPGWTRSYAAPIAAVAYLASVKYPQRTLEFVTKFTTGEDLKAGSPVLALRNRLATDKHLRPEERMALVIQAFNAWISLKSMSKMLMYRGENFPKVKGT